MTLTKKLVLSEETSSTMQLIRVLKCTVKNWIDLSESRLGNAIFMKVKNGKHFVA